MKEFNCHVEVAPRSTLSAVEQDDAHFGQMAGYAGDGALLERGPGIDEQNRNIELFFDELGQRESGHQPELVLTD